MDMGIKKTQKITKKYLVKIINDYFQLLKDEKDRVNKFNDNVEELNNINNSIIGNTLSSIPIFTQVKSHLKNLIMLYINIKYKNKCLNLDLMEDIVADYYISEHNLFDDEKLDRVLDKLVFKGNPELMAKKQLLTSICRLFPRVYDNKSYCLNNYINGNKILLNVNIVSYKTITKEYKENNSVDMLHNFGKVLSVVMYGKNYLCGAFDFVFTTIDKNSFGIFKVNNCKDIRYFRIFKNGRVEIEFKDESIAQEISNKIQSEYECLKL